IRSVKTADAKISRSAAISQAAQIAGEPAAIQLAQGGASQDESGRPGSSPPKNQESPPASSEESTGDKLEEIVVTGSRLRLKAAEGAQEVKIYNRQQIEASGQGTVADFMNTLPDVSVAMGENGQQGPFGGTSVQLHGLPVGTTLVLINGR